MYLEDEDISECRNSERIKLIWRSKLLSQVTLTAGKTTLFNALTGSNQFVGNWPGVTVEKKEGKLKGHKDVVITGPSWYLLTFTLHT